MNLPLIGQRVRIASSPVPVRSSFGRIGDCGEVIDYPKDEPGRIHTPGAIVVRLDSGPIVVLDARRVTLETQRAGK